MKRVEKLLGIALISSVFMSSFTAVPLAGESEKPKNTSFVWGDVLGSSSTPFGLYNEEGQTYSKIARQVRFGHLKSYSAKWYIAGYDKPSDSVVLLNSPDFNLGGKVAQSSGAGWADPKDLDKDADVSYSGDRPAIVGANHYGIGALRAKLKELEEKAFYPSEREHLNDVTVYNYDEKNDKIYTTTDKLYLPYGNWWDEYITVGTSQVNSKESGNGMLNNGIKVSVNSGDVFANPVGNPYSKEDTISFFLRAPAAPTDNDNCGQMLAVIPGEGTMYTYNNNPFYLLPAAHLKAKDILFLASIKHTNQTEKNVLTPDNPAELRFKDSKNYITAKVDQTEDGFSVTLDKEAESFQECTLYVYGVDDNGEWARSYSLTQDRKVKWEDIHEGVTGPEGLKIFIEYQKDNMLYAKMVAFKVTVEGLPGSGEKLEGLASKEYDLKLPNVPANPLDAGPELQSLTKLPDGYKFDGWNINGKIYKGGSSVRIDRESVIKPVISKLPTSTPTPVPTVKPTNTPTPKPTNTPVPTAVPTAVPTTEVSATPEPTAVPTVTEEPADVTVIADVTQAPPPATTDVGKVIKSGKAKYKITSMTTATYISLTDKKAKSASVPATVKYGGRTYKVNAIGSKAFSNKKKLRSVTIGKNVKTVAAKAFYKCKNLKTVTVKATKLKKVGKKAFGGINSKAVFKISKKKMKAYKKLIKKSGVSKKVSYKVLTAKKKAAKTAKKK